MKKRILGLLLILTLLFVIVGCGKETHEACDEWSYDETYHFHTCTAADCSETFDKAEHTFDAGVVTKEATKTEAGVMTYTCTVCGCTKTEEISVLKDIAGVLQGKNNDEVNVTGVAFAKTAEGFYIHDGSAGIYVRLATSEASKLDKVELGNEIKVVGKFAISNGQPFVKNATMEVVASSKETVKAEAAKFVQINALDGDTRTNYGTLYTTVAAVSKDEANRIVLNDDSSVIILADGNYNDYEKYIGKKISTEFILNAKSGNSWVVYALIETASEYFVDVNEVKDTIFDSITLPEEVYGSLTLVTSYEAEPSVVFDWSVKAGTGLTIANNVVTIDTKIAEDQVVTLELKLTSGTTTASKEYTTTIKALKSVALADAKNETGYVLSSGLVVASGIADESNTYQYIIVMDDNKDFYLIQVNAAKRRSVAVGDQIEFVAKWESDADLEETAVKRPCFRDVQAITKVSTGNAVDYASLVNYTLETAEDYQYVIDNNHELIKCYKVVSPYMVGSGSTTYSWNQFGPSSAAATGGLVNSRQFSLLIANLAENGLTTWEQTYAVPTKSAGAKQYAGTVMYVFSVYQTGATKWSFILPCEAACYYDLGEAAKCALSATFSTEVNCAEAGTLTLPASVTVDTTEYTLTWKSSDDAKLNGTTGAYAALYDNDTVTLTASFSANEKEYSFSYEMTLLAKEVQAVTLSEAIAAAKAAEGGQTVVDKLEVYVAAIGASSENSSTYYYGIMLTDGVKVAYYKSTDYTINDHALAYGDKLEMRDVTVVVDSDGHMVTNCAKTTVLSSGNEIDYSNLEVDKVITCEEELVEYIGSHGVTHGLVIKFSGDIINFVGTGTKVTNYRYQLNYRNAAGSSAARYTYNLESNKDKTICFSLQSIEDLLHEVEENGTIEESTNTWFAKAGIPYTSASKSYSVSGSFYAVGGYNGNTLHAWTVINQKGFNLTAVPENIYVNRAIENAVDANITAYEAGTATLLDKVTVSSTEYPITWTSENDAILNGTTGAYAAVTEETKVKLTAHYTVGESAYTYEVTYTLTATEPEPITVTAALALENETKATVKGAVIAFISDGNTAEENKGFMVMDNDTGKILQVRNISSTQTFPEYKYDDNTTAIAIGDQVKLKGTIKIVSGQATYLDLNATGAVTFLEKVTLNYHEGEEGSSVVTISSDAELDALIKSGNYFGKIIKLVATAENQLHVSGSGTGSTTTCNFKLGFHYGDDNGKGSKNQIYYDGLTLSTKADTNAPNTDGTTTFSTALYGATREDGKLGASADNTRIGTLYITICYKTTTYYQASIVNWANCSLTAASTN